MKRKLFFLVAILVFLSIGCNYADSQDKKDYNYDEIDEKRKIASYNQEIVSAQILNNDKVILREDTECKIEEKDIEELTKAVAQNNIKRNYIEVEMVSKGPAKDISKSVGIKEKLEKIKPTPEEVESKIIEMYRGLFSNLKVEYEGKIDNLLKRAKDEYFALTHKQRLKQKLKLGFKYLKLGKNLERECDKRFYSILKQMKEELKVNDLKTDAANRAEKQYKSEKSGRQKELLKKAFGK
ncbi:hypothetical protein [Wukongibacter sp. M2B1]|uniref:hypothetical protein n=1 Tax=Wukongibacter sp. M2B1 TaxID=3088895 RepID=UPI003D7905B3